MQQQCVICVDEGNLRHMQSQNVIFYGSIYTNVKHIAFCFQITHTAGKTFRLDPKYCRSYGSLHIHKLAQTHMQK